MQAGSKVQAPGRAAGASWAHWVPGSHVQGTVSNPVSVCAGIRPPFQKRPAPPALASLCA